MISRKRIEQRLASLTPEERCQYLIDVIEMRTDAYRQRVADLVSFHTMDRRSAHLLMILWENEGRFLTWDNIASQIEFFSNVDVADHALVQSSVKRLRRALKGTGWPIEIETAYGLGVRIVRSDPEWDLTRKIQEKLKIIGD